MCVSVISSIFEKNINKMDKKQWQKDLHLASYMFSLNIACLSIDRLDLFASAFLVFCLVVQSTALSRALDSPRKQLNTDFFGPDPEQVKK
jgi:hypothetical protein